MKQRNEQANYKTEQQKSCKKKRKKRDEFKNYSLGTSSILTFTSLGFQKTRETKGQRSYCEVLITENVPNLGKKTDIQVQKAQNSGKKASTSINDTFIQHSTGSPSHNNQRGKRNKRYTIGKEDVKLSVCR